MNHHLTNLKLGSLHTRGVTDDLAPTALSTSRPEKTVNLKSPALMMLSLLVLPSCSGPGITSLPSNAASVPPTALSNQAIETLLDQAIAASPEQAPDTELPRPDEPVRVKLLSEGTEPRRELRWTLDPGPFEVSTEHHEMFLHRGRVAFTVTQRSRLKVDVVVDHSGPRAEVLVSEAIRETTGEVPPVFGGKPQLTDRRFSVSLSTTGSDGVVPTNIREDDGVDGLAPLYRAVQGMWIALPNDAVGDGAEWQVTSARHQARTDSTTTQTGHYRWASVDAGHAHIVASAFALSTTPQTKMGTRSLRRRIATVSLFAQSSPLPVFQSYRSITDLLDSGGEAKAPFFRSEARGTIRVTRLPN